MWQRFGDFVSVVLPIVLTVSGIALAPHTAYASNAALYSYTVPVGDSQTTVAAVVFDGQFIWVATQTPNGGVVDKLNELGQVLASVQVGEAPIELAYDGANVWVTNYTSSSLSVIDSTGELVKTIFLPLTAHPEGIIFDGKYIWIANNGVGANSVSKFDAASMTMLATYAVGNEPDSVAYDGTNIWVTNSYSNNVMKLNRETGEILRVYPTGAYPLSIIDVGNNMWVGNGAPKSSGFPPLVAESVTELRVSGGVKLGTFPAGNAVRGLAADGSSIWACNSLDNTFTRIRASDGAPLGTYPTGNAPRGIAFDGVRMWIANSGSNSLTVVTPDSAPLGGGLTPQLLPPVPSSGATDISLSASKPRVSPGVAGLNGSLNVLLDND